MTLPRLILVVSLLAGTTAHAAPADLVQPHGPADLDFLAADLDGAPVAFDLIGDGDLVLATADADGRATLVRLDALGARTGRSYRLPGIVTDLAVDRRTGNVVVVGAAGLSVLAPDFAPLWDHRLPGDPAARVAVGELGTIAAVAAGALHILDEHGRTRAELRPAVADLRDVAVLDAAGLVAVTGANPGACTSAIDTLALAAFTVDGAAAWQSHADPGECDTATRGVAVTRGDDGRLYLLAEVDGSLPAFLRDRALVVIDGYTDPETASPAQAAYFARFAADGTHLLGQLFALPDPGAVVRPAAIAADEHGNVFLTGTTSHSLGAADERATTAALDAPVGFYQVVEPDFEVRRVWRPIEADGMTSDLGILALAGDRVVTLLHAVALPDQPDDGPLPPGPAILVWPNHHGPLDAEKRPDPETQGTFGYESGVSGSDPTCYCDAVVAPTPAALLSLGVLALASLPRPRRRR